MIASVSEGDQISARVEIKEVRRASVDGRDATSAWSDTRERLVSISSSSESASVMADVRHEVARGVGADIRDVKTCLSLPGGGRSVNAHCEWDGK